MPSFPRVVILLFAATGAFAPAAQALEPQTGAAAVAVAPIFKDPRTALLRGIQGYQAGDFAASISALKYAAEGGQPLARWKLGQMYATGDGVPSDHLAAYKYFDQIVRGYDDERADPRVRSIVSSAFVSVGAYSLAGIPNTAVRRNPERALDLFHYAATYFGDGNAQYHLARMYLDGDGVSRDTRLAMQWLNSAADKNHVEAQAVLGDMLFRNSANQPGRRARGLMYLTLAREAAGDRAQEQWIVDKYVTAMQTASDLDKQRAREELGQHLKRRGR